MLPDLPGMHNRATDTSLPLMELLCRIAGYGPTATAPEWAKFCSPPEEEILQKLLEIGFLRKNLNFFLEKCEILGSKGHFAVASATTCIAEIIREFDEAIVRLSGNIQTATPPTLNSIFSVTSQYEGSLMACFSYMSWLIDDTKHDELFTGKLLDECYRRLEISHGGARKANEAVFDGLFGAFKRTLIPWLAYGFLDSRTDDFFIREPVECQIYFREIAPQISSPIKAPAHFSARLVEKIAQYGYVRKFLGWRTKNILGDPVLEDQIVALSDRLRSLHWREYRTTALEDIVDSFGELYSHALYVNIFQKCKVHQILQSFQQMYLMGFVDLFDEFVGQANESLSGPWNRQPNAVNDANVKLDLAFEATGNPRKYFPHVQTSFGNAVLENIADRGFSGFSFGIRETANVDTLPIWEYLELDFMVRHPLDWFFHPRAMAKYKQIFRFLLRMKRLNNAFCELWSVLRDATIAKRLTLLDHQDMFYWQYMFTHVIAAVQGYIQVDVIEEAWQELQEKLNRFDDYLQLMEAHDAFLARISMHAMIDNEKLHKCINALVKTCLEVSDEILSQLGRPSDVEVNLESIRGKILDLYSILRMFVKLIQSMSDYNNTLPAYLALKLDFSSNFQLVLSRAEGHDALTTTVNSIPNHPCGYRYHGNPMRTFEQHFGTTSPYADAYVPRDSANDYHLYADIFRARPKGLLPPIVIDLKVTLEELFHGSIRQIEFTRRVLSENGSFLIENESFGNVREEKVTRDVHIRPGWRTGTQIVFDKEGNQAKDKIASDVFVNIVELPHERFRRDGDDLRMKIEVDLLVALCGGDITVTSIDETPIRIEETNVIKPGSSRKIPDFGMPVEEDLTIRGNLFLDYFVNFPKNMDLTRREMIANAIKSRRKKSKNLTNLISVK